MPECYPLPLPDALYKELRDLAEQSELSMADVLRQSARLGLPLLREKLCPPARLKLFRFNSGPGAPRGAGPGLELDSVLIVADSPEQALELLYSKVGRNNNWTYRPELIEGLTAEGQARILPKPKRRTEDLGD